jgi:hypothetical protein
MGSTHGRTSLAVTAIAIAVAAVFLGLRLWTGHHPAGLPGAAPPIPVPSSSPEANAFLCLAVGQEDPATACDREAKDRARRMSLTAGQRARAEHADDTVRSALLSLPTRERPGTCDTVACTIVHPPFDDTDVAAARAALAKAGFAGATVRLARPTDPGPTDSLIFAVPVAGPACVLGYQTPSSGGTQYVVGPLPDNTCLDG